MGRAYLPSGTDRREAISDASHTKACSIEDWTQEMASTRGRATARFPQGICDTPLVVGRSYSSLGWRGV